MKITSHAEQQPPPCPRYPAPPHSCFPSGWDLVLSVPPRARVIISSLPEPFLCPQASQPCRCPGERRSRPAPTRDGIPPARPARCYLGTSRARASRKHRAVGKLNKEVSQGFPHHRAGLLPSLSKCWAQVQVRPCLIKSYFFHVLIPSAASTILLPTPQHPSAAAHRVAAEFL